MKAWSQTSQACTGSPAGSAASRACMKSWYESASLVKRWPRRVTAIRPGLARSIRCGKCANEPSARGTSDTGARAAACTPSVPTRPPEASPRRRPSPVLPREAAEWCSLPVGACGSRAALRASSCGKPPQASSTPQRARTSTAPSGVVSMAPVTRSPSRNRRRAGERVRISTPASSADAASPATSALPFTSRRPRRCNNRSFPCASTRFVTNQNEAGERMALRKWRNSAPEAMPMPQSVVSGSGGFRSAMRGPRRRPSNGAAQRERPPSAACGVRPWKSGMALPSMKRSAVFERKNWTMCGAASRNARARCSSKRSPSSWRR